MRTVILRQICNQCSKLRVHPAPVVHILVIGCTGIGSCAPGMCMLFSNFNYIYIKMST